MAFWSRTSSSSSSPAHSSISSASTPAAQFAASLTYSLSSANSTAGCSVGVRRRPVLFERLDPGGHLLRGRGGRGRRLGCRRRGSRRRLDGGRLDVERAGQLDGERRGLIEQRLQQRVALLLGLLLLRGVGRVVRVEHAVRRLGLAHRDGSRLDLDAALAEEAADAADDALALAQDHRLGAELARGSAAAPRRALRRGRSWSHACR